MQLHTFRTTAVVLNSGGSIVLVMDIATVLWGSGSSESFIYGCVIVTKLAEQAPFTITLFRFNEPHRLHKKRW